MAVLLYSWFVLSLDSYVIHMYIVKAPPTVSLYLYFFRGRAKAKYRYNGTVRGALTVI